MIRDASGNILTSSDRHISPSLDPKSGSIPIEESDLMRHYRYNNGRYTALNKSSTISDWTLTKLIPTSTINKEINALQYNLLFVYIACIVLVLIGIFITALRLYKPIYLLTNKLRGQLKTPNTLVMENPYKVQNILVGYELLIEQVDETVEHLIQESEARRRTELDALKMQINPHFLYNTLNSIKCLVWTNKSELIEPTITALVKILQQTSRRKDELTTLGQELENVKNYLYIQNVRMDNHITITYDVKKSFYHVPIPPLTLQPIVENAIFHGIEPCGAPGILSVSAFRDQDDLYIEILDNGAGMSEEKLKALSNTSYSAHKTGFTSLGLDNVKERLKLYYGNDYGLEIKSKVGVGTSVLVKIKYHIGGDVS